MVIGRRVQLVQKPGPAHTGIGRYVAELERGLEAHGIESVRAPLRTPVPSIVASGARRAGYDLETFFASYPLRVQARSGYLTHLTSQTLGGLLLTQRLPRPVVVTVHDILPYLLRNDRQLNVYRTQAQRLMDALAMRGLKRADRLIADSHYTKSTLCDTLGIGQERIDVVHLGVDCERFSPDAVPPDFRARNILPDDRPYLLYVGSEDPRKNLRLLFKALARVRREFPTATLLKVGSAGFDDQRAENVKLCSELGISDAVRFFDDVAEDELPRLYQLASVLAFPSLHEGFGFPVLEALACGTPVVAANASSIPELAGDAARLVDGNSVDEFAAAILDSLIDQSADRRERVARAMSFSWSRTIERTLVAYAKAEASCGATWSSTESTSAALPQQVDQ